MKGSNEKKLGRGIREKISREARERLELVTSRLQGMPLVKRLGILAAEPVERLVVISDIHIGDPKDTLASKHSIQALKETLEGLGGIDELVLLGDVFDFWKAPVYEALKRARPLIETLYTLSNVRRIVYIPGNHDHHVFRMHYEMETSRLLAKGELGITQMSVTLTNSCPVMEALKPKGATVPLFMAYPTRELNVQGKRALLTHGHFLGFFERSLWKDKKSFVGTLLLNRSERLDLEEMEMFLTPFYEMLTLSAFVPGINTGGYRVFRMLNRAGRAFGLQGAERTSAYRNRSIEEVAAEIEALLNRFCEEKPAYFVYGHTHRSGRLSLPISGVTAINTGCWLDDPLTGDTQKTLLEISDEARFIVVDA